MNEEMNKIHEKISRMLYYKIIPKYQIELVFEQKGIVDIDPNFMGFVGIYEYLSHIIPRHFTVVDLGAGYNAQSYLFPEHKKFIAVDDARGRERFRAPDTEFYDMKIEDYIKKCRGDLYLEETFAICSYVPPWGADNMKLVRENFINIFTYYPHESPKETVKG